jgi:hypothetical protein
MSTLIREGHFAAGSVQAPYAIAIFRSESLSSKNLKPFFAANAALASTESKLAPRIRILFSS